jgi:hypothetical protein
MPTAIRSPEEAFQMLRREQPVHWSRSTLATPPSTRGGNRSALLARDGRGTTVLELLMVTALFALVMGGVYLLYTTMQTTLSRGEAMSDIQQNARTGMNRLIQEVRMAGNDPNGTLPNPEGLNAGEFPSGPLRAAGPDCVTFIAPGADPATGAPASSRVSYYQVLGAPTLWRRAEQWTAGAYPITGAVALADTVAALALTYYDGNNSLLVPQVITVPASLNCPPTAGAGVGNVLRLTIAQLDAVRRIGITLQTQTARPGINPQSYTLGNEVLLRNVPR